MDDHLKIIMSGAILTGAFVLVPIIFMLTRHQVKMASLMRHGGDASLHERVSRLEQEVDDLRRQAGNGHQALTEEQRSLIGK